MNKDVQVVECAVYNTSMLLGDVGGMYSLLVLIASTVHSLLNYKKLDNTLVTHLFKVNERLQDGSSQQNQEKHLLKPS